MKLYAVRLVRFSNQIAKFAPKNSFKWHGMFSDYRDFGGVKWPTTIAISRNGEKYVTATRTDIKPSPKIDAKAFEKP